MSSSTRSAWALRTTGCVDVSPFSLQVAVTTPAGPLSNPYVAITNPFPPPAVPSPTSTFLTPVLVMTYDPRANSRMEAPVTYKYNLTVEHQFPKAILGRIGVCRGAVAAPVELNPAVYRAGSTLSTDQRRLQRVAPGYSDGNDAVGGSIGQGTQDLISNHNSLQSTAQRRMQRCRRSLPTVRGACRSGFVEGSV